MIPAEYRRNRALTTAYLAKAQLSQGDVDQACETAGQAIDLMAGSPMPGRMRTKLGDFQRSLLAVAADVPAAREWNDRARLEWTRTA